MIALLEASEREERRRRADRIEDIAAAVWGGEDAERRVRALRTGL